MKILGRVLLVLVLVLIVAAVGAYFYLDTAVRNGITYAATEATGEETTLDSASVGLFSAEFAMNDLQVDNPEGFTGDYFLRLGGADTQLSVGSLLSDTIELPRLHLSDVAMNLEFVGGEANYQPIMERLEQMGGGESQPDPQNQQAGKGFKIQDAVIDGVTVRLYAEIPTQDPIEEELQIGRIELGDIGTDTESGVALARVSAIVVREAVQAVLEQYGDQLPTGMLDDLQSQLGNVSEAASEAGQRIQQEAGEAAGRARDAAEDAANEAGDAARDAANNAGDAIRGIFGGDSQGENSQGSSSDEQSGDGGGN